MGAGKPPRQPRVGAAGASQRAAQGGLDRHATVKMRGEIAASVRAPVDRGPSSAPSPARFRLPFFDPTLRKLQRWEVRMGLPTWMYRRAEDGALEAAVFDSDALPEGWADSPARCAAALV